MLTFKEYAQEVNKCLENIITEAPEDSYIEGEMPGLLTRSMRYSLLAPGKRLRPSMFLAAVDMLGGDWLDSVEFACSIEMIHCYSLIHDDLPGMDNDTMRRGRPTNHVVYGVGQAILAGDGLLNYAFENMLKWAVAHENKSVQTLHAIREIAIGAGVSGMIGGQVVDLMCENSAVVNADALSYIHRDKTACMFRYPLRAAGYIAGANPETIEALGIYGECFGRLFQATDDILDVIGDTAQVGETLGKDAEQGKLTAVSLYGLEGAKEIVTRLTNEGITALNCFGKDADIFRDLLVSMENRSK